MNSAGWWRARAHLSAAAKRRRERWISSPLLLARHLDHLACLTSVQAPLLTYCRQLVRSQTAQHCGPSSAANTIAAARLPASHSNSWHPLLSDYRAWLARWQASSAKLAAREHFRARHTLITNGCLPVSSSLAASCQASCLLHIGAFLSLLVQHLEYPACWSEYKHTHRSGVGASSPVCSPSETSCEFVHRHDQTQAGGYSASSIHDRRSVGHCARLPRISSPNGHELV